MILRVVILCFPLRKNRTIPTVWFWLSQLCDLMIFSCDSCLTFSFFGYPKFWSFSVFTFLWRLSHFVNFIFWLSKVLSIKHIKQTNNKLTNYIQLNQINMHPALYCNNCMCIWKLEQISSKVKRKRKGNHAKINC